ncbi:hypothetical protein [uncultured Endozoicomonas sp.]|uniref:hypothetical protein n=1 Tax=uncultured Endozoicomonas sp. TaxID=432652 RepID=UPI00263A2873|nr:hypothetical protein [uncultured Endozoicomonas sp.]
MQHPVYEQYLVTGSMGNNHQTPFIVLVDSGKPVKSGSTVVLVVNDLPMIGTYHHRNGQHSFVPEGQIQCELLLPDAQLIRGQVTHRCVPEE